VREEEYWSVEKVTDGSAFAYEQQQLREEREHKSNGNRRGGGRKWREQKAEASTVDLLPGACLVALTCGAGREAYRYACNARVVVVVAFQHGF
jgi:hypothetical protein